MVWLANITHTIACNNFLTILAYISILANSRFSDAKKVPDVGLDQWMNLATKMIDNWAYQQIFYHYEGDERQPIERI